MIKVSLFMGDLAYKIKTAGDQDALDRVLMGVAESTRLHWSKLAMRGLHTARQAYIEALSQPQLEGPGIASIELGGDLPQMLENGADAFSLRTGLLESKATKISKDGHKYAVVRMRVTGPGSRGAAGQPVTQVYAPPGANSKAVRSGNAGDHADTIGRQIWEQARKLKPGEAIRPPGLPKLKENHTFEPLKGLTKLGEKGHHYYATFRTVSDAVDKFNHPGFVARNFMQSAAAHAARIGPLALKRFANTLMQGPNADPGTGEEG